MRKDPLVPVGFATTTPQQAADAMRAHAAANGDSEKSKRRALEKVQNSNSPAVQRVARDMSAISDVADIGNLHGNTLAGLAAQAAIDAGPLELEPDDLRAGFGDPDYGRD